jgi:hypothetical protein
MTLDEFEDQVTLACANSSIVSGVAIISSGVTWIRLRAYLIGNIYLDAFYNEVTGKTAYALIEGEMRVFGADNTGGWHWHPYEQPHSHRPVSGIISFQDFLKHVEEHMNI